MFKIFPDYFQKKIMVFRIQGFQGKVRKVQTFSSNTQVKDYFGPNIFILIS